MTFLTLILIVFEWIHSINESVAKKVSQKNKLGGFWIEFHPKEYLSRSAVFLLFMIRNEKMWPQCGQSETSLNIRYTLPITLWLMGNYRLNTEADKINAHRQPLTIRLAPGCRQPRLKF